MNESKNSNPSFIARETLKQLALLKVSPTPDNYHKLYDQIAGNPPNQISAITAKMLTDLAKEFPRHTPQLLNFANNLEQAANERNWIKFKSVMIKLVTSETEPVNKHTILVNSISEPDIPWGGTIEELFNLLAAKNQTLICDSKWQDLHQVLIKFSKDSDQLHNELRRLIDSWCALTSNPQEMIANGEGFSLVESDPKNSHPENIAPEQKDVISNFTGQMLELLAQMLEHIAVTLLDDAVLTNEARTLAQQVRKIQDKQEMEQFVANFQKFCVKFESHGESGIKLQQGLLKLLNLLMDSTGELLSEDQWIKEQISRLKETMSRPLNLQIMAQAEQYLKEIIHKQEIIKQSLGKARVTVKQMVNSLIHNIEELTDATGTYQVKLEYFSDKVNQTNDLEELNQLLVEIMQETKQVQSSVLEYRDDLIVTQAEVKKAQVQISQLEIKLLDMEEKVQEDHLTGIFNRRGLDCAFEREISRAQRNQEPLCFVLLDIDNFKQLNDTHGHKVGDDALVFLVGAIKETTRPEDIVSRYGGEEFAILLPNTVLEEALMISSRILRNLTKKFFLYENKRLLITFSAGVAQYQLGESQESIFKRADQAMYKAKKTGKNQILAADNLLSSVVYPQEKNDSSVNCTC
jgi:diguanylate cyclase